MSMKKVSAVILCVLLCLTALPASVMAAEKNVQVELPVSVRLEGDVPSTAETYTIILKAVDDAPMPSESVLKITGAGTAKFPAISYSVPGVYCYTVSQNVGGHERGHYDTTVYYVRVTVTNAENGGLDAAVAVHTDAQMQSAKQDVSFRNTYDKAPSSSSGSSSSGTTAKTTGTLIQTGQINWPVPVLAAAGLVLILAGLISMRKKGKSRNA